MRPKSLEPIYRACYKVSRFTQSPELNINARLNGIFDVVEAVNDKKL